MISSAITDLLDTWYPTWYHDAIDTCIDRIQSYRSSIDKIDDTLIQGLSSLNSMTTVASAYIQEQYANIVDNLDTLREYASEAESMLRKENEDV